MAGRPRPLRVGDVPARLVRAIVSARATQADVRHITPVEPAGAVGTVGAVYAQMRSEVGLLPPFTVYSPQPRLLAAAWAVARESWLATTLEPATAETIAVTVSRANGCPYCVDAHDMFLRGAGSSAETGADARGAATGWAEATLTPGAALLADPPFAEADLPAATAVAVSFHMTNRVANVFLPDSALPIPVPAGLQAVLRGFVAATFGRELARRDLAPGLSLSLPPASDRTRDLPGDLGWAAPLPAVAAALARLAHVTEDLARQAMPAAAVARATERIDAWAGETPGPGKTWVREATAGLDLSEVPTARLALLAALASWQVEEADISDVRRAGGDDADVVTVVAWGAFRAARRIGTWL